MKFLTKVMASTSLLAYCKERESTAHQNFPATKGRGSHSIPSDRALFINPDNQVITVKAVKGSADQSSLLTSFKQLCWGRKKSHNSISLEESIPH